MLSEYAIGFASNLSDRTKPILEARKISQGESVERVGATPGQAIADLNQIIMTNTHQLDEFKVCSSTRCAISAARAIAV
jgi:hypothetical protein